MADNLKQKMLGALAWSSVDRLGQQVVQFVISLILARLLNPTDFGLLGMVMIFSALSYVLVESGFGQALIRKQDANETDYNTIFYFNIATSVLLYLILFAFTPAIARFFVQPKLVIIGRIMFLAILFNALYLVPFTKLAKKMDFRTIAKVNIFSTLISGICGIIVAFLHYGIWALVTQQVFYQLLRLISIHFYVKWTPKFLFSFNVLRDFWKFSINLLATSVLNVLFNNLYVLLLSYKGFYPIRQVGYYTQSNKLSETFNFTFQSILVGSTYALFTQIQHDEVRFRYIFREIAKKTSIITFPILFVLIAVANPFIYVLLSEKWMPIVPYFQLLCLASLFGPLYTLNVSALNSRGNSKATFQIELIKKILILISVVVSYHFGIIAMLCGYVLACFIAFLISTIYLKNDLNHFYKHQFKDYIGSLSIGLFISIIAFVFSYFIHNNYLLLGFQISLSFILYILSLRIFEKDLFKKVISFIVEEKFKLKK